MLIKGFRALSRTLSIVEAGGAEGRRVLKELYPKVKERPVLGITGLPGAGKSTLIDKLIAFYRKKGESVGVIAVDPSSPFSGGALLGDRIRMQRHATDSGVFIRSLGSRGAHGGLSHATRNVALCMDAFGFDRIIIETVGVGQTELDIMGIAGVTVVVLVPESGDAVQTLKAGLMEIADIFVVNKAELKGALPLQTMLKALVSATHKGSAYDDLHGHHGKPAVPSDKTDEQTDQKTDQTDEKIPVLLTQAEKGIGTDILAETIAKRQIATAEDVCHQKEREVLRRAQFLDLIAEALREKTSDVIESHKKLKTLIKHVERGEKNPYTALEEALSYLTK